MAQVESNKPDKGTPEGDCSRTDEEFGAEKRVSQETAELERRAGEDLQEGDSSDKADEEMEEG